MKKRKTYTIKYLKLNAKECHKAIDFALMQNFSWRINPPINKRYCPK
jgi:hypothetical protein